YTALTKNSVTGNWYDYKDSHISQVKDPESVVRNSIIDLEKVHVDSKWFWNYANSVPGREMSPGGRGADKRPNCGVVRFLARKSNPYISYTFIARLYLCGA